MWNIDKGALVGAVFAFGLAGWSGGATAATVCSVEPPGEPAHDAELAKVKAWIAKAEAAGDDIDCLRASNQLQRHTALFLLVSQLGTNTHTNCIDCLRALLRAGADPDLGQFGGGRWVNGELDYPPNGETVRQHLWSFASRTKMAPVLEARRLIPKTKPAPAGPSALYDALMNSGYAKAGALIENATPDQLNHAETVGKIDGVDVVMTPLHLAIWKPKRGAAERRAILDRLLARPGLRCEGEGDYAPLTYFARHHPDEAIPAKLTELCQPVASASASLDEEIAAFYVATSTDYFGGVMQRVDLGADPNVNGLVHFSTKTSTIEVECLDDRGCRGFFEKDFRLMCSDAETGRYALERDIDAGVHPAASLVATKASRQGWVWAGYDARSTLPTTPSKARDYHPLACEMFGFGRFKASVRTTIDP